MKYVQLKLDETTHALLTLAKTIDPEAKTLETWAIKAIQEKLQREGLDASILRKPAAVAAE